MKSTAALLALALGLLPQLVDAASWWNNDWKFRKEIGFDLSPTGADVAGTPQDVPVLVRLSLANFSYFNDTKPDGSDFRLVSGDDKTPLKYHFEKYDPQSQIALLWVRVPQLTGGAKADKIYAYYGNTDAPAGADVPGTYDTSQVLVLSFAEAAGAAVGAPGAGAGAAPVAVMPKDSTAYQNNPGASTAVLTPASLIGGGAKFSGKESITIPASASLRLLPNQGFTASAWVRIEAAQQSTVLALSDQGKQLSLELDGTKVTARALLGGAPVSVQGPELALSQWHHVALTAGAGKLTLYLDGAAVSSAPLTLVELGGTFSLGSINGGSFFAGDLDEVEAAKVARSADWIKASARSQSMDSNLVLYGADGQHEGSGQASYFVTIAKNLTIDGWVVIGICMAMLAIALVIMLLKAIFLSRVEKANSRFLEDFRKLGADATALVAAASNDSAGGGTAAEDERYGVSTLFKLYHNGVYELNKRVAGNTVSAQHAAVLSPQSVEAIRATMDATLTRLQQRLSSQMVLLTIAISGGPFLGLLGTVIGVMITFAAIALSGDVNVNAIAPGTAAALAATVAGLSVAIPALFGYNWLNTRIKTITADNRVFLDEFVARMAEQYS
jgi:biopolymer transport protein ExbB